MSSWWGIVNPAAGGGANSIDRVQSALDDHGLDASLHESSSAEHVAELVDQGLAEGFGRFLAVGGDGTASLVVDALLRHAHEEAPILGILPGGSGCDFVRTFGISQILVEAAVHLTGDDTYAIDVAVLEGAWGIRHALNAVDVGVLAASVHKAAGLTRRLGRFRYKAAFWLTLPLFKVATATVTMERRSFEGSAANIVLSNGQFFGFGANVAPKATLVDGLLDVQVFACSKWKAVGLYPKVIKGTHLSEPTIRRFRSGDLAIETDHPWPVEVDGDYLGTTPFRARVLRRAIRFKL